jgi:hypothetical protein
VNTEKINAEKKVRRIMCRWAEKLYIRIKRMLHCCTEECCAAG